MSRIVAGLTLVVLLSEHGGARCGAPDFQRDVLPLLYNRCYSCHSEKAGKPKAGLRLDTLDGILRGAVVPGKPGESELLARTALPLTDDGHMPPLKGGGQPLSEAERDLIRRWIAGGAKAGDWKRFDHREPPVAFAGTPLKRADVPELARRMDELVAAYHKAKGTKQNPPASDETFLRRVYLDVAGRIPTLAESTAFLADDAADKRAKLIDKLLASEAYVSHTFNWKADQLRLVTRGFPGLPGWSYDRWVKEAVRSGMAYDRFVRELVTAKGYLWENGAVGFYLRDLGMPLDHMSNLSRLFLGTRIECAQCHDHPHEPITQRDFYQLAAYTYGVSNLCSPGGYSTDNVKEWNALQALLKANNADEAVRQSASGTVAPLKRVTLDTDQRLKYPSAVVGAVEGKAAEFVTPFGDDAPVTATDRREAFAAWLSSPRNPRFAKNIANRLFKRVMGLGLIEPVDSLSPVDRPQHPELLAFLTESIARLGFDERAFLAVLLNSRLYQSEPVRTSPEPGAPFTFQGPMLRRLSAEQLWDSMLTLLVEDLDARKPQQDEPERLIRDRLVRLSRMNAGELYERSKQLAEFKEKQRKHSLLVAEQKAALQKAKEQGDAAASRRIQREQAEQNERFEREKKAYEMDTPPATKETDRRWAKLPGLVRASEIPTPIPQGHFLRQFGQSDRREIDASNKNPNVTHPLALMNGELTRMAVDEGSYLRKHLPSADRTGAIYLSILARRPTDDELKQCRERLADSPTPDADLIWALLNSSEFLFTP